MCWFCLNCTFNPFSRKICAHATSFILCRFCLNCTFNSFSRKICAHAIRFILCWFCFQSFFEENLCTCDSVYLVCYCVNYKIRASVWFCTEARINRFLNKCWFFFFYQCRFNKQFCSVFVSNIDIYFIFYFFCFS